MGKLGLFEDLGAKLMDEEELELIDKRRWEQYLLSQRPKGWLHAARRHLLAANILYECAYEADQRQLQRILNMQPNTTHSSPEQDVDMSLGTLLSEYFLLAGYALENCFKGILIGRDRTLIESGALGGFVKGHDLCKLAAKCGITLSTEENELLALMTRHVVWGKYPAPIKLEDTPSLLDVGVLDLSCQNPYSNRRVQVLVNAVYARAAAILDAMPAPIVQS